LFYKRATKKILK
jgi:hypothetical protein